MAKIGILTFHCAINFGAALQSYATYAYLRNIGHDVSILDYRPDYLIEPYKNWSYHFDIKKGILGNLKKVIASCLFYPIRKKRHEYFNDFLYENFVIKNLDSINHDNYDAIVLGSDQIWNPGITHGFDPIYFGEVKANRNLKLIYYGASCGSVSNLAKEHRRLEDMIPANSILSVREKSLYNYICEHLPTKQIYNVVDPVLMAGAEIFEPIISQRLIEEPYLVVFQLGEVPGVIEFAKEIAAKKNLRLISITSSGINLKRPNTIYSNSIPDFLSYIRHADYVVTTSFHGTAFSILFRRNFTVLSYDSERMENLLQDLGIASRLSSFEDLDNTDFSDIDYASVDMRLRQLSNHSREFLRKSLSPSY